MYRIPNQVIITRQHVCVSRGSFQRGSFADHLRPSRALVLFVGAELVPNFEVA